MDIFVNNNYMFKTASVIVGTESPHVFLILNHEIQHLHSDGDMKVNLNGCILSYYSFTCLLCFPVLIASKPRGRNRWDEFNSCNALNHQ